MLSLFRKGRDHVVTHYPSPKSYGKEAGIGLCHLHGAAHLPGIPQDEDAGSQSEEIFSHLQRIQPNQINERRQTAEGIKHTGTKESSSKL